VFGSQQIFEVHDDVVVAACDQEYQQGNHPKHP